MINTTQTFYDNSIYKYRNTKSEIEIRIFDNTVKSNIENVSVNGSRYIFDFQVYDDIEEAPKYATGELNNFKLDGSMTLLPNTLSNEQIGWWSPLSDVNGEYETNPKITITMANTHTTAGITIFYDKFSYPLKSKCYWYNDSTLLDSMEILQDKNIQVFEKGVSGFNKIVIEILKAKPYAYAKVLEIDYGIIRVYDDLLTQGAKTKEITSLMANTIEPNELNFSVINYDEKYNLFNPQELYRYFKQGQICKVKSGVLNYETNEYEYVPMGTFYIDNVKVGEGLLDIKAFGILNQLNNETFYSNFYTNKSVSEIVDEILGGYPYYINPNVKDITLSGYIPITSKKEALKYVLIACGGVCKESRDGKIYIFRASEELSSNQLITEDTEYYKWGMAGLLEANVMPIANDVKPIPYIFTIGRDTRLSEMKTELIGYYNRVDITYKKYTLGEEKTLYDDEVLTDINGQAIIEFSKPVSITSVSGVDEYYAYATCLIIVGDSETTYNIQVVGNEYEIEDNITSIVDNGGDDFAETKLTMELKECNTLIADVGRANEVGKWYLSQLQKRKDIEFDWWSIATTESSDYVKVITSFDKEIDMQISEIEYNLYDLIAKVKGIG